MGFIGSIIALGALFVAAYQLKLQKDEVIRSGKVPTLIHMASVIKDKIEYHEKIIEDQKEKQGKWKGHADRVNNELRPLLEKLNRDIIEATSSYDVSLSRADIRELITQQSTQNG